MAPLRATISRHCHWQCVFICVVLLAAAAASAASSDPADPPSNPPAPASTSPPTSPPTDPPTFPPAFPPTFPPTSPAAFPPKSLFASLSAALPRSLSGIAFTQGRPVVKGKVFSSYVAKLRPTRNNGKLVGDKGATGKVWLKGVKAFAGGHYVVTKLRLDNIQSGGTPPQVQGVYSCMDGLYEEGGENFQWQSITGNRGQLANRYSFIAATKAGPMTKAEVLEYIQWFVSMIGNSPLVASHPYNNYALCGKLRKKR